MRNARVALLLLCAGTTATNAAEPGALLAAAKAGDGTRVQRLLAERTNPNAADADGTSALHWAVHVGDLDRRARAARGRSRRRRRESLRRAARCTWPPRMATRR